jgi:CheY-like chemotaxis protein
MLLIFVEDVLATADPNLRITTALNGMSGIKEIERIIPDLVLLDYSLPDLTGDEVCRRLLQDERTARVPVLMMSGHVPEMAAAAARLENVVKTIAKPFLSDALVDVVARTLAAGPRPASSSRTIVAPTHAPAVAAREPKRPEEGENASESIPAIVSAPPTQPAKSATVASKVQTVSAPLVSGRQNDVVLGLFLEVVSMQFTPQLRMGAVRAKPFSFTVSLHMPSAALRAMLPLKTGFQLGQTELDANGRITTLRLSPTLKPFQPAPTRNAFEIGDVAVIPAQARERLELMPAAAAAMTMQLLAQLELVGVQLSPTFQVAQLILKWRSNAVRVTFSSNGIAEEKSGAAFETAAIQLDNSARIAELLLNPIR